MNGRLEWPDPTPYEEETNDEVPCPVCAGAGFILEHDGARDWCDECGASGMVEKRLLPRQPWDEPAVSFDYYADRARTRHLRTAPITCRMR